MLQNWHSQNRLRRLSTQWNLFLSKTLAKMLVLTPVIVVHTQILNTKIQKTPHLCFSTPFKKFPIKLNVMAPFFVLLLQKFQYTTKLLHSTTYTHHQTPSGLRLAPPFAPEEACNVGSLRRPVVYCGLMQTWARVCFFYFEAESRVERTLLLCCFCVVSLLLLCGSLCFEKWFREDKCACLCSVTSCAVVSLWSMCLLAGVSQHGWKMEADYTHQRFLCIACTALSVTIFSWQS